ncbi:hypothetical protein OGAPHI_003149 [Ogataea philodendri]|uniref:UBX domain-containing protein 1 n=1 Tax=Ogataea philodendri TaxID=1378263 RepID=A0A9P8P950_9ASCO|nr:uncharacterized protein OGAPHI_003149 [Ogataea philodendri]KAH3667500.1 hypothetical protein OGAPHI_003149 [Ogataea philodendri]
MSEDAQLIDKFQQLTGAPETVARHFLAQNNNNLESFSEIREQEDDDEDTNLFTGGEKSGLQVENPDKPNPLGLVQELIKKAEREGSEPDRRKPLHSVKQTKFTGTGYKLGSVDNAVDSKVIEDSQKKGFRVPEKVNRTITFWKEGFQVGEGKLYRYDDPNNADYLRQLNSGRAPLSLLDVEMFQDVDVTVVKKMDESYTPPKPKQGGFVGSGQRLGSPVPGEPKPEPVVEETAPAAAAGATPEPEDQGAGDAKVQIRLADGSRVVHNFNSSDDVSTVFEFVKSQTNTDREWVLAHAFPMKVIERDSKSIKDAGLVNSVVVQRWK